MKPAASAKKSEMMLEAARRLFAEVGYEAASMDLIAKTAGVSKATLYAHFESKENLFVEILEAEIGRPEDRDWIPERFEGDAEGVLRRFAQRHGALLRRRTRARRLSAVRRRSPPLSRARRAISCGRPDGDAGAGRSRCWRRWASAGRWRSTTPKPRPTISWRSFRGGCRSTARSVFLRLPTRRSTGVSRARCSSSCAATLRAIRRGGR